MSFTDFAVSSSKNRLESAPDCNALSLKYIGGESEQELNPMPGPRLATMVSAFGLGLGGGLYQCGVVVQ